MQQLPRQLWLPCTPNPTESMGYPTLFLLKIPPNSFNELRRKAAMHLQDLETQASQATCI